jgi:RNA polymerase sigma factor (sigma-70 family)
MARASTTTAPQTTTKRAPTPATIAPTAPTTTKKPACDDDALKARVIAGDPAAIDELFRCTHEALTRYLRGRCGNAADADDALQNTFENATRFLDGYRGDATPRSWLFRVAANACTRMRRGKKNTASIHVSVEDRALIDERSPDPEARLTSRADVVLAAVAALDPVDRTVILLRDGQGLSAKETATQLGLTEAAVKSRLFRARKVVREAADAE